ncbi:MAG TPA: type 1 glutamine amidotransferase [Albitalea sp.]
MKPVLILQHLDADGPAYLDTWLRQAGRPFELFNSQAGQHFPDSMQDYAALAVLGGEMSANDPLPSLRQAERLILQAMHLQRPVIGHCLGGQLMARALGATVGSSPLPEIGWHRMWLRPSPAALSWFGEQRELVVFQWHYDAFDLPEGAEPLGFSDACPCQAFAIGPHLAMQFHVELDEAKLTAWISSHDERFLAAAVVPTVQDAAQMRAGLAEHLQAQQRLAARLYARWIALADQAAR